MPYMRVALDAIPLVAARTGIGHYTEALSTRLASTHPDHQYELMSPFDFAFDSSDNGHPTNLSKRLTPVRGIFRKWWLIGLPALLQISPVDVFHGTNYCIPLWAPCPTVVTIHDLSLFTQSSTHEAANVTRGKRRIPIMARRANLIIAPSTWTSSEIQTRLGIREDRIRVIHEAARDTMRPLTAIQSQKVLNKYGIDDAPYLLYVGTIEPRKNLMTLVRAYDELLRTTRQRPKLVLCGGRGWLDDEVFKMVTALNLDDMVRFTGYVADDDLPALYSRADVFVYPSLYEGFGLPPLEAMACGTCVVTSDSSSIPEVVGDAAVTVPARDWRAMAGEIAALLADPHKRAHYQNAGLERARMFSWERAAHETQSVYDEVFENSKR